MVLITGPENDFKYFEMRVTINVLSFISVFTKGSKDMHFCDFDPVLSWSLKCTSVRKKNGRSAHFIPN